MISTGSPPLRIGLLGLGTMGERHMASYGQIPGVEVFTRESERFRQQASCGREALYAAMIDDPILEALDLCLPTPLHAQLTIAALQAGKHVLCEKPMALHPGDCEAMVRAAEKSGRILMIGHVLRFAPPYRILKDAIDSAAYGALKSVEFTRSSGYPQWAPWLSDPGQSGGAVLDLLVHDFDQALAIAGAPSRVTARQLDSADSVECDLIYEGADPRPTVSILGGWYADARKFSMGYRAMFQEAELVFREGRVHLRRCGAEPVEMPLRECDMYVEQQRYFVDCVRSGLQSALCPPSDAAQSVSLAILAREAAAANSELTSSHARASVFPARQTRTRSS